MRIVQAFGAVCLVATLCGTALAKPVPIATQRLIEAHFAPNLPLPDLAIWQFDALKPYPGGGDLVCGKVNFPNSTRVYLGKLGFYVVIRSGEVSLAGIEAKNAMQDPTGAFAFAYRNLCVDH